MADRLWEQYARASWGLTGITMLTYAAVISYLRRRPNHIRRDFDRPGTAFGSLGKILGRSVSQ
jgi:hypothetical protein